MSQQQQTTTLQEIKNPAPREQNMPAIRAGFFDLAGFELLQRVAKGFAASTLVPTQYQGNVANCMIALNLAQRLGADALMVMQNLYIVHGSPGWSSKFLIASVNTSGRFTAMRYEWRGQPGADDFGCRAWAKELSTGERLDGIWVDWKMVKAEGWNKKNGSKWNTMPDQMFVYRAAAFWQRAYAPEISMGMSTAEELHDVIDINADGSVSVSMGELRSGPLKDVDLDTGEVHQNSPASPQQEAGAAQTGTAAGPAGETSQQATQGEQQDGGGQDDGLSYAKVRDSLENAKDLDVLDVAADLITQVRDPGQQEELRTFYRERKEVLTTQPATTGTTTRAAKPRQNFTAE